MRDENYSLHLEKMVKNGKFTFVISTHSWDILLENSQSWTEQTYKPGYCTIDFILPFQTNVRVPLKKGLRFQTVRSHFVGSLTFCLSCAHYKRHLDLNGWVKEKHWCNLQSGSAYRGFQPCKSGTASTSVDS